MCEGEAICHCGSLTIKKRFLPCQIDRSGNGPNCFSKPQNLINFLDAQNLFIYTFFRGYLAKRLSGGEFEYDDRFSDGNALEHLLPVRQDLRPG
jgi:hypothetical protein